MAVCKDCTERVAIPNCHMTCERYLEEKRNHDAIQETIKKAKEVEQIHWLYKQKCERERRQSWERQEKRKRNKW